MSCLDLDRVSPTKPPTDRAIAGYQGWRQLLFLHWSVAAEDMRRVVPPELELDLWDGRAFVGAVPFEMVDIRPAWVPRAMALDFLETNLRTYVHYRGEPGVFFFSLEASSRLAVQAARWGWSLPYHFAHMSSTTEAGLTSYQSTRTSDPSAELSVRYRVGELLGPSPPGTLEHFFLERYYLFALRRGRVWKGHVSHVPYPAQRASLEHVSEGLVKAAGLPAQSGPPELVHYASGVDVEVFGPWPLEP